MTTRCSLPSASWAGCALSGEGRVLWVEILSRQGDVVARHRVECGAGDEVRIGRGYDNHVVLDDAYVAARHLRIARDQNGRLVAQDLGSANGLFVDMDRRRAAQAVLEPGRTLRIGRTRLRIRQAGDEVPPERISRPRTQLWPIISVLALVALGGELLTIWLRETTEQRLSDYLGRLVILCVSVAVWTTAWATLSRIFARRARFERHLLIALGGLLALSMTNELFSYAAFAWSRRELVAYRYVAEWLVGAYICFLHLQQVSQTREIGRRWLKPQAGAVTALALIAIGMQTLPQWEASQSSDRQAYLRGLKPPAVRLVRAESPAAFFAEVAALQGVLDQARSEAPGRISDYAGEDDE